MLENMTFIDCTLPSSAMKPCTENMCKLSSSEPCSRVVDRSGMVNLEHVVLLEEFSMCWREQSPVVAIGLPGEAPRPQAAGGT